MATTSSGEWDSANGVNFRISTNSTLTSFLSTSDAADWVTETCVTDPVNQTFRKPLGEL